MTLSLTPVSGRGGRSADGRTRGGGPRTRDPRRKRETSHEILYGFIYRYIWGGASEGESKCYVLTRFDAFVLIVTDIGRPTHGHTDGYDGLGLGLNRYVKICMCYRSNSVYTRPGSAYIYAFIYKAQA